MNISEEERSKAETRLYETILVLAREERLPQSFKVQSAKDVRLEKLAITVEQLTRSVEVLGERVRALENRRVSSDSPQGSDPSKPMENPKSSEFAH